MEPSAPSSSFSLLRTLKLSLFHFGSSMVDILVTGVWNRVLITDLAINATPVAWLAALRYLIAPLGVWIGHESDTRPLFGKHRLSYIYLGRLLTWLSLPLLPQVIIELSRDRGSPVGWTLALFVFLLYGLGTVVSGGTFLALVRESAPPARQGLAVVIVYTVLLASFAIVPIAYSRFMSDYTPEGFWFLVGLTMVGAGFTWFVSVWGEERNRPPAPAEGAASFSEFRKTLREILGQGNTRAFFWLLATGAIALFSQDAILEPFGGDIFGLDVGETTRFNAYYGTGVLLAMLIGSALTRKWAPHRYTGITGGGLLGVAATLALLAVTALGRIEALLVPSLFLFGLASGVYTLGGLSLMIAMTDDRHAGAYLGLWTMAQLVFRGVGIALGGTSLSIVRALTSSDTLGYGSVFILEMVAALVAFALLVRISRTGYLNQSESVPAATRFAAATE